MIIETDNVLSALVHSDSKEGKSTLSSTAPPPILVIDAEGSWKFIDQAGYRSGVPLRTIRWDPLREAIPRHNGEWEVCRVHIDRWETMEACYRQLRESEHDFVSIVLDSITEIQRRCKQNIRGATAKMEYQQWGDLLERMDGVIRGFRDLTLLPNSVRFTLFNAETVMKDGRWRPNMQGAIRDTLPYWVDVCGFLFTEMKPNGDQAPIKTKKLLIGAGVSPAHIVGERVQGRLPDIIDNPHFTHIMNHIFPNTITQNTQEKTQ
jgi:hypothetical protein